MKLPGLEITLHRMFCHVKKVAQMLPYILCTDQVYVYRSKNINFSLEMTLIQKSKFFKLKTEVTGLTRCFENQRILESLQLRSKSRNLLEIK